MSFFMSGVPGQGEADEWKTYSLAGELNIDHWSCNIYTPLPVSYLYEELLDKENMTITYCFKKAQYAHWLAIVTPTNK